MKHGELEYPRYWRIEWGKPSNYITGGLSIAMFDFQRVVGSTMFFPHIFVWGSCFWFCTPASGPPPPPASSSYNLPTHNLSSHNLSTHNFRTRNLSTHNLSTFTTCPHTTCPPSLCVAGVALGDSHLQFAWQAWHLWHRRRGTWRHGPPLCVAFLRGRRGAWMTSTFTLRGRRGTDGTGLALVARLVPRWRRGRRGFLRGRRGTWWHPPSLCVAGVALMALGWLCRRAWLTSTFTLRGRRGT